MTKMAPRGWSSTRSTFATSERIGGQIKLQPGNALEGEDWAVNSRQRSQRALLAWCSHNHPDELGRKSCSILMQNFRLKLAKRIKEDLDVGWSKIWNQERLLEHCVTLCSKDTNDLQKNLQTLDVGFSINSTHCSCGIFSCV